MFVTYTCTVDGRRMFLYIMITLLTLIYLFFYQTITYNILMFFQAGDIMVPIENSKQNNAVQNLLENHEEPSDFTLHHTSTSSNITMCGRDMGITRQQLSAVVLLSLFFFLTSSFYSIFAPFYPGVATKKGMSETQIGIIFGIFQFTLLVLSPIFGKYVSEVKRLFKVV